MAETQIAMTRNRWRNSARCSASVMPLSRVAKFGHRGLVE